MSRNIVEPLAAHFTAGRTLSAEEIRQVSGADNGTTGSPFETWDIIWTWEPQMQPDGDTFD